MKTKKYESGQALIVIVFAIVGLLGMTGLAVDGGMVYSDRSKAQNAADSAALAGALANSRGEDITTAAMSLAASNSYNNNGTSNIVAVTIDTLAVGSGACPGTSSGYDINVQITSNVKTYFAPVVGVTEMTNNVFATSRSCGAYTIPLFDGNALVSLGSAGIDFEASGSPVWNITGGGIFSNSSDCKSVKANGSYTVTAPSITMVATACGVYGITGIPITPSVPPYTWDNYKETLPPTPECTKNAVDLGSGNWEPAAGTAGTKIGSKLDLATTAMHFAPGLYCIDSMPPNNVGSISGTEVTFYSDVAGFDIKYAGSGAGMTASAPTSGFYQGVLLYIKPELDASGNLLNTQELGLRGNGNVDDINGSIIAPSASITMFGNSNANGYKAQFIGYNIDTGGSADITVHYDQSLTYQSSYPASIQLLK